LSRRAPAAGHETVVRASGSQTGGAFYMSEHLSMPPGFGTPYHTHTHEDEIFYVLDGEVAFVLNGVLPPFVVVSIY